MKDETYVFIQDSKEKKAIARGSRFRRSHAGKGGSVRFPSDHLTKKELKAMNGEIKTYRMNEPMTWGEFKSLPDDLKITYIKALRERFGVPDKRIAEECFGVYYKSLTKVVAQLGISLGRGKNAHAKNWDKAGWNAWLGKVEEPEEISVEENAEPAEVIEARNEERNEAVVDCDPVELPVKELKKAIPMSGSLHFEGTADDILASISNLLGNSKAINATFIWSEVLEERM